MRNFNNYRWIFNNIKMIEENKNTYNIFLHKNPKRREI